MAGVPLRPLRDDRPWGNFIEFTKNEPSTVKIITVNPGEAFSLQKHAKRDEFWHVISGDGTVTVGDEKKPGEAGSEFFIPRGTNHRLEAGSTPVVFLEVSFGEFDESDITRIDDKYGRT